jgi:ATP-dependent DNA helicase RecQ
MKGETPARIVLPSEPRAPSSKRVRDVGERRRGERGEVPLLEGDEHSLFERLRARRAEIAKQRTIPAYIVAHDRTLVDMARKKPRTPEAMLCVHGMGPSRVEQYGERFLDVIVAS